MSYEQWLERYYDWVYEGFRALRISNFEAYAEHAYGQYQLLEQDHED
jgi:hypothetical protein